MEPRDRGRHLDVLAPADNRALHRATAIVAPWVESRLGNEVMADRLIEAPPRSEDGLGWLAPWKSARRTFDVQARVLSAEAVVLRTDVRDCYGSITAQVVGTSLVEAGVHPLQIGGVCSVLNRLHDHGVRGLPVGPPASSVLANAVLARVDRCLTGIPFLRWVDDYVVFARDTEQASVALRSLRVALDNVGLAMAPEKTSIGAEHPITISAPTAAAV